MSNNGDGVKCNKEGWIIGNRKRARVDENNLFISSPNFVDGISVSSRFVVLYFEGEYLVSTLPYPYFI